MFQGRGNKSFPASYGVKQAKNYSKLDNSGMPVAKSFHNVFLAPEVARDSRMN